MKIKGKVFTAQQVQSMIAGNMNMFREVIKPQPIGEFIENESWSRSIAASCGVRNPANSDIEEHAKKCSNIFSFRRENGLIVGKLAPYRVGQKIFCKEKFSVIKNIDFNYPPHDWRRDGQYIYEADAARSVGMYGCVKWKPAQHMKQEHSRLTLLIKEIRVERLASISVVDARDEGCPLEEALYKKEDFDNVKLHHSEINPFLKNFIKNWNATHKKPEEKFEANPFVWVCTMEVVK